MIVKSLKMSVFLYGLEVWGSAFQGRYLDRIDTFIKRTYRFGYTNKIILFSDVIKNRDSVCLRESLVTLVIYFMTCFHLNVTGLLEIGVMTSFSLEWKMNGLNGLFQINVFLDLFLNTFFT